MSVVNVQFQCVGLSCIIESQEELKLDFWCHFPNLILNCICHNTIIYLYLHGSSFEDYFSSARKDRYNLTCLIYAYDRLHATDNYESSNYGGRTLTDVSATKALTALGHALNLIEIWLKKD